MITRDIIISRAIDECIKELYLYARPQISWDKFVELNKEFLKKDKEWNELQSGKPSYKEYCGPKPFEFYYLPKDVLKDIVDSYINAYKLDGQQELLDTIEILKDYCKNPIIEKYIEGENGYPGYRGYEHPDNLEKELDSMVRPYTTELSGLDLQNKFFEFLDMARKFYNWNRELNFFSSNIYLGCSPSSNKEAVVENWKKYKNQDIEINEEQIKQEYYGDN